MQTLFDLKAKIYDSDKEKTGKITLFFMCLVLSATQKNDLDKRAL